MRRWDEAEALFVEALAGYTATLGEGHSDTRGIAAALEALRRGRSGGGGAGSSKGGVGESQTVLFLSAQLLDRLCLRMGSSPLSALAELLRFTGRPTAPPPSRPSALPAPAALTCARLHPSEAALRCPAAFSASSLLAHYASRGAHQAAFAFALAARRSGAIADADVPQAIEALASALTTAGCTAGLRELYEATPWAARSPRTLDALVAALTLDGASLAAISATHAPDHPSALAWRITALAGDGDLEGAVVVARGVATSRAGSLGSRSPSAGLTSAPFDALILAAGRARAPALARAVFEALVLSDVGHSAALNLLSTGATSDPIASAPPLLDEAPPSVAFAAAGATAVLCHPPEGSGSGTAAAAAASVSIGGRSGRLMSLALRLHSNDPIEMSLFDALARLRTVGEVAPTTSTYVALVSAYAANGDVRNAAAIRRLLLMRCALEMKDERHMLSSPGSDAWRVPPAVHEALLDAIARQAAMMEPAVAATRDFVPAAEVVFDDHADLCAAAAAAAAAEGRDASADAPSPAATGSLLAVLVACGDFTRAQQVWEGLHSTALERHPGVLSRWLAGLASVAERAAERLIQGTGYGADADASTALVTSACAEASRIYQLYVNSVSSGGEGGTLTPTGAVCSAALAAACAAGDDGFAQLVVRDMTSAQLEPKACDFIAVCRGFLHTSSVGSAATFARALINLDRVGLHRSGAAASWVASALARECDIPFACELLSSAAHCNTTPPDLLMRTFAVASASAAAAEVGSTSQHTTLLAKTLEACVSGAAWGGLSARCVGAAAAPATQPPARVAESTLIRAILSTTASSTSQDIMSHDSSLLPWEVVEVDCLVATVTSFLSSICAFITSAPTPSDASRIFSIYTSFVQRNASVMRLVQGQLFTRVGAVSPPSHSRAAASEHAATLEGPYLALFRRVIHSSQGEPPPSTAAPAVTVIPASATLGSSMTMSLPTSAGVASISAFLALLESDGVAPTHTTVALALTAAQGAAATPAIEEALLRRFINAISSASARAHPAFSPAIAQDLVRAVSCADTVLPLRLAAASANRDGARVVSLWHVYSDDKRNLAASSPAPFAPHPPATCSSAFLAALAATCATGCSEDASDATLEVAVCDGGGGVAQEPVLLAAPLALHEARTVVCKLASRGLTPLLCDVMSLSSIYAMAGLMPDARLLLRLTLSPFLGRDYNQQLLQVDAIADATRLSTMLSVQDSSAPAQWPGQAELLDEGMRSTGLAFGAQVPPGSVTAGTIIATSPALDSGAFCDIVRALVATELVGELLTPLIEHCASEDASALPNTPRILDRAAAVAAFGAFAAVGHAEGAEGIFRSRSVRFACAEWPPIVMTRVTRQSVAGVTRDLFCKATPGVPLLPPQFAAGLASPVTAATLVNTLRISGLCASGEVLHAARLLEHALASAVHATPPHSTLPRVLPLALSALLHYASRCSAATLLTEVAFRDAPLVAEGDGVYANAQRLLGVMSYSSETRGGGGAAAPEGRFLTSRLNPEAATLCGSSACLLARIEAIALAATTQPWSNVMIGDNTTWWSPSPTDTAALIRLYSNAARTEVGVCLGWHAISLALEGAAHITSPDLPILRTEARALTGTAPRAIAATAAADVALVVAPPSPSSSEVARIATAWGFLPSSPPPSMRSTRGLTPSLFEALATCYAVGPPHLFVSGSATEHTARLIAITAETCGVPLSAQAADQCLAMVVRHRIGGALPPTHVAPPAPLPLPSTAWYLQTLASVGTLLPVDNSPTPAQTLSITTLHSLLASAGYSAAATGGASTPVACRGARVDGQTLLARLAALRSDAARAMAAATAAAAVSGGALRVSALHIATDKAFAPRAPSPSTFSKSGSSSSVLSLSWAPSSRTLGDVAVAAPVPFTPSAHTAKDEHVRRVEAEVLALQSELAHLIDSTASAELALRKLRQEEASAQETAIVIAAATASTPVLPVTAAAARACALREALDIIAAESTRVQDAAALGSSTAPLLARFNDVTLNMQSSATASASLLASSLDGISAVEGSAREAMTSLAALVSSTAATGPSSAQIAAQGVHVALTAGAPAHAVLRAQTSRVAVTAASVSRAASDAAAATEASDVLLAEARAIQRRDRLRRQAASVSSWGGGVTALEGTRMQREALLLEDARLADTLRTLRARIVEATSAGGGDAVAAAAAAASSSGSSSINSTGAIPAATIVAASTAPITAAPPFRDMWQQGMELLERARTDFATAQSKRETAVRTSMALHLSESLDLERTQGRAAIEAAREATASACDAVGRDFKERSDVAASKLWAALEAELRPIANSANDAAAAAAARISRLGSDASALQVELARLEASITVLSNGVPQYPALDDMSPATISAAVANNNNNNNTASVGGGLQLAAAVEELAAYDSTLVWAALEAVLPLAGDASPEDLHELLRDAEVSATARLTSARKGSAGAGSSHRGPGVSVRA